MAGWVDRWDMIEVPERWTFQRKARVVAAIAEDRMTINEAMARFDLSPEELEQWTRLYVRWGSKGLRTTKRYGALKSWPQD